MKNGVPEDDFWGSLDDAITTLKDRGYEIIEPEPESFVRKINGREAILVRSRL